MLQNGVQAETRTVPAAALFVLGAKPQTDWLLASIARDDKEFILTGQDVPSSTRRDPLPAWTSAMRLTRPFEGCEPRRTERAVHGC